MDAPQLQIGEVAARTGLSLRTIRWYGEVGLVEPSARSAGGFRLYTDADVARLLLIMQMKPLGFSLEQMSDLLGLVDDLHHVEGAAERAALVERLATYHREAVERVAAVRRQLDVAERFAADIGTTLERAAGTSSPA